jgi:hypothetical protein
MGVLAAFFVGWALGARGGQESFREVMTAVSRVRDSEEFAELLAALRAHAGFTLQEVGRWMESPQAREAGLPAMVDKVRAMVVPRSESAPAS